MARRTIFVAGFSPQERAKDIAYEFERFGRLVRCDIPAPRSYTAKPYAFVEFEDPRDADAAYHKMQGKRLNGYNLDIQWAKNSPASSWRGDDRRRSPARRSRRSPSPRREARRGGRSRSPHDSRGDRERSPRRDPPRRLSPDKLENGEDDRRGRDRDQRRERSPEIRRSGSPMDRDEDRRDQSVSPSPKRDRSLSPRRTRSPEP